jgi:septal ring factor EnvC (AmiA/AmiB activator)
LVLVIVLIGYNIFTTNNIRTDVKGYEARIESVQTKIDSAQVINKQIDVKIDSVKENVISITKEIHHIDNTITIVKKQTDEKINTVDKFSNAELEFFFTNRYHQGNTAN